MISAAQTAKWTQSALFGLGQHGVDFLVSVAALQVVPS
jgi:hypothetical protein